NCGYFTVWPDLSARSPTVSRGSRSTTPPMSASMNWPRGQRAPCCTARVAVFLGCVMFAEAAPGAHSSAAAARARRAWRLVAAIVRRSVVRATVIAALRRGRRLVSAGRFFPRGSGAAVAHVLGGVRLLDAFLHVLQLGDMLLQALDHVGPALIE